MMENEALTFSLSSEGLLPLRLAGNVLVMDLMIREREGKPYVPVASFGASTPTFDDDEQKAEAWRERTFKIFGEHMVSAVRDALGVLLYDAAHLALIEENLVGYDKRGALHQHLAIEEKIARERLKMGAGRPPMWTAPELAQAIATALDGLDDLKQTYAGVATKLKEVHPERAPKSGESLRKTVKDLGIDWKRLKKEARERDERKRKRS